MMSKKYSIIIVPDDNEPVVNRRISRTQIVFTSLLIFCFFAVSAYLAVGFFKTRINRQHMEELSEENRYLASKIDQLEGTVYNLMADMSGIMEKDDYIRLVFDIPPLDSELREVGIGGENYDTPRFDTELGQKTWLVEENIEKIQRQLELENASFEDLLTKIEKRKATLDHTPTIKPCEGMLSRGFGMHNDPFTGLYQPHNGIDLAAPHGTSVSVTADGVVKFAGYQTKLGKTIIVDHGYGIRTYYGHLSKIKVKRGQRIKRHDIIGLVGSSGYSTGPHLHYEVRVERRPVNPYRYILRSIIS